MRTQIHNAPNDAMTTHHLRKPIKPIKLPCCSSSPKPKFLFLISMASFLFLALLSLAIFLSLTSAARNHQPPRSHVISPIPQIQQACKATRFPDSCQASLAGLVTNPNTTPIQIIQSAIQVSTDGLQTAQKMVKSILDSSAGNENRTTAAKNCLDVLHNSEYRISLSTDSLSRGSIRNARASMSAALLYQYDCWSALKYANDTQMVNQTMSFLDSLTGKSSNALSMMFSYDNFGKDTKSWAPPKTERDGYWERLEGGGSGQEVRLGVPSGLKADVTVCKEESEKCYRTVQEAVKAAPDNAGAKKFVIRIKAGVYDEIVRVPLEKRNVVFLGDGMGKTVITGSLNVGQPGISTYNTATVGVLGDGFVASGLTIQNTAGPDVHQAVAFRSDSDLSVIENCEFLGNQDTLYAHSNRQLYKSCNIQGNVDFIFGNSAAVFQDCNILVRPRQQKPEKGENNAVTAQGRTDPAQSTGFVFQNCLINGTEEYMKLYRSKPQVHKNYLGRPWKEYSRTVFINCNLEALITPQGWMPWSGDFALKTLFYGEVGNSGAGSDLSKRVSFSSKIPSERVNTYSVQNFIQGNEWIST
ncbi:PREDICTED: probable pectinesterase/pectinesterase [Prunus dulcis]|uniref:Pectinesterase n=2 Tax=Prunus dulcis TaxID=3755 RepID=A0A5E4G2Y0_PRUDU|nr:probable pectinesterase/pectinesterase inhibitor 51 [Prunus dulcis]VVA34106.1 PREDICTED: probable pectinesterase/pectinesterase [Prunus dulcis]VVA34107.1 PREDICTED: probable pectinesterase/pectinesterase [Prunus dulcis]